MPLDARKIQHMFQVIARSLSGRQRPVVVVYRTGSGYTYSVVQVIMRPLQALDPQILNINGQANPQNVDTLLLAPLDTNFTGAVYIADTATPTTASVGAAPKFEVVEVLPVGIVPGGSHLRISLRRMH